jgi:hypothetical protein
VCEYVPLTTRTCTRSNLQLENTPISFREEKNLNKLQDALVSVQKQLERFEVCVCVRVCVLYG